MISVCMTTHNGEKFIKEQLESILCQLGPTDEVIISDDGSTDKTIDFIQSFNDPRINVYHFLQPAKSKHTHLYVTRNFEHALKYAKGDYVFFSDQDDKWMPNKVNKCVEALQKTGLVVHNMRIADWNMNDTGKNYYTNGFQRFKNYFMLRGKYYGCTIAFRKELLHYILPYPKKLILHDYWTGIIAECFGGVTYIDEPLILYRLRQDSASHNVNNSLLFKISYRIYTLMHLYKRIMMGMLKIL